MNGISVVGIDPPIMTEARSNSTLSTTQMTRFASLGRQSGMA